MEVWLLSLLLYTPCVLSKQSTQKCVYYKDMSVFLLRSAAGHACQLESDSFILQHVASELGCCTRRNTVLDPVLSTQPRRA